MPCFSFNLRWVIWVLFVIVSPTFGQENSVKRSKILPFPVVFYTPETRFAFGAAVTATLRFKSDSAWAKPSQVTLGAVYTQNKQLLLYVPFQVFYKNNKYYTYGEVGYFRYNFFYFGVGQENPKRELYGVDFPRIKLNFFRAIKPNLYVGVRYQFEQYDITETETGGQFQQGRVPGGLSSRTSGLGLGLFWDKRDAIFFPTKGYVLDLTYLNNSSFWGGNVRFDRLAMDLSAYQSLNKKIVLAGNLFTNFTLGDAPFNMLTELGGPKKMRGYYQGRFRDDNAVLTQAELRFPIYGRLGAVVNGSLAWLGNQRDFMRWNDPKSAYGAGLRFVANRRDHLNIRLDYAIGSDGGNFYFTIGEAF
jgi:outer membrane protein assembly factor BamA